MLKRPLLIMAFLATLIFSTMAVSTAGATHDTIYSPCGTEYGFIHMTYVEWAAHIATLEADGSILPGMVSRYWEAEHDTGKGTNIQDDGTIPAWDQWARGLTEGQILSINDWANGNFPELEQVMFDSGLVPEWVLDANRDVRRFNDPYWSQANPMTPSFTVWESLCMGNYGYSLPVMEINDAGVWESNIPTTTTVVPQVLQDPYDVGECSGIDHVVYWGTIEDYSIYDLTEAYYPYNETILMLEARYPGLPGYWSFDASDAYALLEQGATWNMLDQVHRGGGILPSLTRTYHPQLTDPAMCYHFTNDPAYHTHSESPPAVDTVIPDPNPIPEPEPEPEPAPEPAPEPESASEPVPVPELYEADREDIDISIGLAYGYDLWDAQFEGWPFYETLILLEERYPPNTPNRHHFRLSVAIEFLRNGGMIAQLDRIWESGL